MALYGFKTREERLLFTKLLGVSGIGPKGALAILASGQTGQVVQAIEHEDEKFLVKFPGVGKNSTPNDFRFKRKTSRCRTRCIC